MTAGDPDAPTIFGVPVVPADLPDTSAEVRPLFCDCGPDEYCGEWRCEGTLKAALLRYGQEE